jgi:hypothetical protein
MYVDRMSSSYRMKGSRSAFNQIRAGKRFPAPVLEEQVGAEKGLAGFFKEEGGVPGMGDLGGLQKPEAMAAGGEDISIRQHPGGPVGEVGDGMLPGMEQSGRLLPSMRQSGRILPGMEQSGRILTSASFGGAEPASMTALPSRVHSR